MKFIVVYLSDGFDIYTKEFNTLEEAQKWAKTNGNKNVIVHGGVIESNN